MTAANAPISVTLPFQVTGKNPNGDPIVVNKISIAPSQSWTFISAITAQTGTTPLALSQIFATAAGTAAVFCYLYPKIKGANAPSLPEIGLPNIPSPFKATEVTKLSLEPLKKGFQWALKTIDAKPLTSAAAFVGLACIPYATAIGTKIVATYNWIKTNPGKSGIMGGIALGIAGGVFFAHRTDPKAAKELANKMLEEAAKKVSEVKDNISPPVESYGAMACRWGANTIRKTIALVDYLGTTMSEETANRAWICVR